MEENVRFFFFPNHPDPSPFWLKRTQTEIRALFNSARSFGESLSCRSVCFLLQKRPREADQNISDTNTCCCLHRACRQQGVCGKTPAWVWVLSASREIRTPEWRDADLKCLWKLEHLLAQKCFIIVVLLFFKHVNQAMIATATVFIIFIDKSHFLIFKILKNYEDVLSAKSSFEIIN